MTTSSPAIDSLPTITVVMPVWNEAAHLVGTLEGLLAQRYPRNRLQILVVDGGSTDRTADIAQEMSARHALIEVRHNRKQLSSAARNIGIEAARGEIVLIVDGHCQFAGTDYLQDVARGFASGDVDCLGRPQPLAVRGGSNLQRAIAAARASWFGHHPGSYIYSKCESIVPAHSVAVAYRREVFERVGRFDERFDACEDVELNHRVDKAGLRCRLVPAIGLAYQPRASLRALFRQLARYGAGRVRLARKHPETVSWLTFAPALMVATAFTLAAGTFVWWPLGALLAVLSAMYFSLALGQSAWLAVRERKLTHVVFGPWVFLAIHWGAGVGALKEFLFPRLRA